MSLNEWISALVSLGGVPIINWLKVKFGLKDEAAVLLSVGVSFVIALIALFVVNQLHITDFTLTNFANVFTALYSATYLAYKLLIAYQQPE